MGWIREKLAGWKTLGTAWSAVMVVLADYIGWYEVPGMDSTSTMLWGAVVAALVVTFAKAGISREIAEVKPPEA